MASENKTDRPVDMRDRIKEQCELAHFYAEDGAYYSAARVLRDLAEEVGQHAQKVSV